MQAMVSTGTVEELANWVANPGQFVARRQETAIVLTDQVPVWLKVPAGQQLISERSLDVLRDAGRVRKRQRLAGRVLWLAAVRAV